MIATETDARRKAAASPSLAAMMLARGAQLPTVAPRTVEQAVTKAETVEDAPAETVECANHACAHATPGSECDCYTCFGAGHGWIVARAQDAARIRTQARIDERGIFQTLRIAGAVADDDFDPVTW